MQATIKINMDNAAFDGNPTAELQRILKRMYANMPEIPGYKAIMDVNGNKVGSIEIE